VENLKTKNIFSCNTWPIQGTDYQILIWSLAKIIVIKLEVRKNFFVLQTLIYSRDRQILTLQHFGAKKIESKYFNEWASAPPPD